MRLHVSYAFTYNLYVVHSVIFAFTCDTYVSICVNKQLHALYTNLHSQLTVQATYPTTFLLFMQHADMYNLCTYTYYTFIIYAFK